jgi:integrase
MSARSVCRRRRPAETGARIGEIKWLTWDDIDFDNRLIHIQAKEGCQPMSDDIRAIPMIPKALHLLKSLPRRGRWVVTAVPTAKFPSPKSPSGEHPKCLKRIIKRLGLTSPPIQKPTAPGPANRQTVRMVKRRHGPGEPLAPAAGGCG